MPAAASLHRTALHKQHQSLGARLVDFHGWELPIQYVGILREHQAVRTACGLFDVSHMGQIFVEGRQSRELLQKLNTNDIGKLKVGSGIYSHMANAEGGVIDDVIVSRLTEDRYLVVVNAGTSDKDFAWMKSRSKGFDVVLRNESGYFGMIALQGPSAAEILGPDFPDAVALPRFGAAETRMFDQRAVVTRTGYTGEDGFEVILAEEVISRLWQNLVARGRSLGLEPCGLGARDTLRLEAGYLLYGQDIDDKISPLEAGCGWVVRFDKGDFIGRKALARQKKEGLTRWMTGVRLTERGVPRPGAPVFAEGRKAGTLSSATYSPTLKIGIGMGRLDRKLAPGTAVEVEIHGRKVGGEVVRLPFYKRSQEKNS